MWITLIKRLYALLQNLKIKPNIHQGESLCGRLLPLALRVSEKNSSRKLAEQVHLPLDSFVICSHVLCKRSSGLELRPKRRAPMGRTEPVVQPATSQVKEVAHEAHLFGDAGDGSYGGDVDG